MATIGDYRSNEQGITNDVVLVLTDDQGNITGYVYKSSDVVMNAALDETQLQAITESNYMESVIADTGIDLGFINASLLVLIVSNFAVLGALAVQVLLRSLHGRD